jgi:hypothetical protein
MAGEAEAVTDYCFAYLDDDDPDSQCVRPRGHDGSHVDRHARSWPNMAPPAARKYKPRRHANEWTIIPKVVGRRDG